MKTNYLKIQEKKEKKEKTKLKKYKKTKQKIWKKIIFPKILMMGLY